MDAEHQNALKRAFQAEETWAGERRSFMLIHSGGMQSEIDHPGWDPSWSVPSEHTIDDLVEEGLFRLTSRAGRARTFIPTPRGTAAGRRIAQQAEALALPVRVPAPTAVLSWLHDLYTEAPEAFEVGSRLLDRAVASRFIDASQRSGFAQRVLDLVTDGYLLPPDKRFS